MRRTHLWAALATGAAVTIWLTQARAQEIAYLASGERAQGFGFVGGSACCGCETWAAGTLPADLGLTSVSSVTFYLSASRSDSYYDRIQPGSTRLRLRIGDAETIASTVKGASLDAAGVPHTWRVTFEFTPPAPVRTGATEWSLTDGDGEIYSAAVLQGSSEPCHGLPATYTVSGCQYARSEPAWYSASIRGDAGGEPLDIQPDILPDHADLAEAEVGVVELPAVAGELREYAVMWGDVEISRLRAESLSVADGVLADETLRSVGDVHLALLEEYAGGNICLSIAYRLVWWRADGSHGITDRFGNCQAPAVERTADGLVFRFEGWQGRYSFHEAETWVFENLEVRKKG